MADLTRIDTVIGGPFVAGGGFATHWFLPDTVQDAADAVLAFWTDIAGGVCTGTTFTVQPLATQVEDSSGEVTGVDPVTGGTATGSGGVQCLPLASQGVVQWRTGVYLDGREIRGRTFIPAMSETTQDSGVPASATVAAYVTPISDFISATGANPVVYRRKRLARPALGSPGQIGYRPAVEARDGTFAAIALGSLSTKWGVLRSRRD